MALEEVFIPIRLRNQIRTESNPHGGEGGEGGEDAIEMRLAEQVIVEFLAAQLLRGSEVTLSCSSELRLLTEVSRARMQTAERLAVPLQYPSSASHSSGSAAARSPLPVNEQAEVVHGGERVRMPIAEGLAPPL